jgi:hypothetical protein
MTRLSLSLVYYICAVIILSIKLRFDVEHKGARQNTHTHTRVTDVTRMARFGRSGGRRERETLGPTPLDEMGDAHTHTHTHTEINKLRCSVMTRGKRLADIKPATKFLLTSLLLNHITCVIYPFAACESTCVYIAQCV